MSDVGYIRIIGWKKDITVRGGESISSRKAEDILSQHPRTHDVYIVATPDERLGGRSYAYMALKPLHHSLSPESVVTSFSRKRVTKHKYPEHIVIVEKLPHAASDKVQKHQLRQDIIQRLSAESTAG